MSDKILEAIKHASASRNVGKAYRLQLVFAHGGSLDVKVARFSQPAYYRLTEDWPGSSTHGSEVFVNPESVNFVRVHWL